MEKDEILRFSFITKKEKLLQTYFQEKYDLSVLLSYLFFEIYIYLPNFALNDFFRNNCLVVTFSFTI